MMDRFRSFVLSLVASAFISIGAPLASLAEPPRVQFDMPYAVACRDVTPAEYTAAHPGYKLIEVKLAVSSLLTAGQEKDLTEYFIRVDSPQRTLTIADY